MKIFKNGLLTGLVLQLAIGPVFFYILNLSLERTIFDGLIGSLAVALVDFAYVGLAIIGIGKILEKENIKKIFRIVSSIIFIIFGFLIIKDIGNIDTTIYQNAVSTSLLSSFLSVLPLTISNPLTIVLYTGILTSKGIGNKYSQKKLLIFGLGIGFASLLFMSISTIIFSLLKGSIPIFLVQILNGIVGILLIIYGISKFFNKFKKS